MAMAAGLAEGRSRKAADRSIVMHWYIGYRRVLLLNSSHFQFASAQSATSLYPSLFECELHLRWIFFFLATIYIWERKGENEKKKEKMNTIAIHAVVISFHTRQRLISHFTERRVNQAAREFGGNSWPAAGQWELRSLIDSKAAPDYVMRLHRA